MVCPCGSSGGKGIAAAFIIWPWGDFVGRRGTLSWSSPIRPSSSWTWASWKTFVARIDTHELREEDYATIHSVIESYVGLFFAVGNKNTTHRAAAEDALRREDRKDGGGLHRTSAGQRLRSPPCRRCSLARSGRSRRSSSARRGGVRQAAPARGRQRFASDIPAVAIGDAPAKPSGHGRNGANAYTAAEKIEVPHPSLQPGDPCPTVRNGNRLRHASVQA